MLSIKCLVSTNWSESVWPVSHILKSLITSQAQIKQQNIAQNIFSLLRQMQTDQCPLLFVPVIDVGFSVGVYSKSLSFKHKTLFLLRARLLPLLRGLAL